MTQFLRPTTGFNDLLTGIDAGTVGVVAVTDISRLTRNLLDFARFAASATRRDVLLVVAGRVMDLRDADTAFIASLFGLTAIRDGRARSDQTQRARRKKAEAGIVCTSPPTGYVRVPSGWDKHPDLKVRDAIDLVFDKYEALGSARQVVRWINSHGVLIPTRARRGQLRWLPATTGHLCRMLRHPAYAGIYVYGRTTLDESGDLDRQGRPRRRLQPAGEWVYHEDRHPAYVTPARWAAIQTRLTSNRITNVSPIGRGAALLSGLLRCDQHGRRMITRYNHRQPSGTGSEVRMASYVCQPHREQGNAVICLSVMAAVVDAIVETEVLTTLAPHALDALAQLPRSGERNAEIPGG